MSIAELYVYTTSEDSLTEKDWAAGSSVVSEHNGPGIAISPTGKVYGTAKFAPAWLKMLDEPIVNAMDNMVDHHADVTPAHRVTTIQVTLSPSTGEISVYNNGKGVDVAVHPVASERLGSTIYVPTLIFGMMFQGRNRKKDPSSITGGTNGIGVKICKCLSTRSSVETVDDTRQLYFKQTWAGRNSGGDAPTIIPCTTVPYTRLTFLPDYAGKFGYAGGFTQELYNELVNVAYARVLFAAAYIGSIDPACTVWFNGCRINVRGMNDVANILYPGAPHIDCTIKSGAHPWHTCVVVAPGSNVNGVANISNVNGIVVREGKHFKKISNGIVDSVSASVTKLLADRQLKFSPTHITNNIVLLMNCQVPGAVWSSQSKDVLQTDIKKFVNYVPDAKFMAKLSKLLHDIVLGCILQAGPTDAVPTKKKKTLSSKCVHAKYAGGRRSGDCKLIMVEGDSAMSRVCDGISNNMGFDYIGVMCLGGVIINVRKECTTHHTSHGEVVKQSTKLTNNVFMNAFCTATSLDTTCKYTTQAQIDSLTYGCIVACVDQDLDGKGHILGLILNVFHLFWPNLLGRGYVKWFCTPLIRAYPISKKDRAVLEFYATSEYNVWAAKVGDATVAKYKISYCKGLGTHSDRAAIRMFRDFQRNLHTYGVDVDTNRLFEIYFGKDPDLRKVELSQETKYLSVQASLQQLTSRYISCSDHLRVETNIFQKDNLARKLDHCVDGQNQSGRKILDGAMKYFRTSNNPIKVYMLAGAISESEHYQHGEESLNNSIQGKAFLAPGGKQLPILIPLSNFGSRAGGGSDAAKPRYTDTKLNKPLTDLLFPREDYYTLEFNFDGNDRVEPKYFIPIVPLCVLESSKLPAHGWKQETFARDVFAVIALVRRLINGGEGISIPKLPLATYQGSNYAWTGTVKSVRGAPHTFGRYRVETTPGGTNSIRITELPLRVWTLDYRKMLFKKIETADNIIADIHCPPSAKKLDIVIKLKPGALARLEEYGDEPFTDGVEEYFQLRSRINMHLNHMDIGDVVKTFASYEDVVRRWYPVRKAQYQVRVRRHGIIQSATTIMYENIIRYIENASVLNLSMMPEASMIALLEESAYVKIWVGKLNKPDFTPADELERVLIGSADADYSYLLGLTDRGKSAEALARYKKMLADHLAAITADQVRAARNKFPGQHLWEQELDQLERTVKEGFRTSWTYDDFDRYDDA